MAHEHHVGPDENELSMLADSVFAFLEEHPDFEGKKAIVALSDGQEAMMATAGYEEGEEGLVVEHMLSHAKAVMRVNGGDLQTIVREGPAGGHG